MFVVDVKQLLALAGNKQKESEGKGQSASDKVTIANVTLDSILQDRLGQNTDSTNVKITIPYTVFEALKARNLTPKDPASSSSPSTVSLSQSPDVKKESTSATTKPQVLTVVGGALGNKDSTYPNIRSRLISHLSISGAQTVSKPGQGQIRPALATAGKKTFEKVTVQAIPQLTPVNLGTLYISQVLKFQLSLSLITKCRKRKN